MLKNATPKQIALYIAGGLALLLAVTLILFKLLHLIQASWGALLVIPFFIFIAGYFLGIYTLRVYIYRKVKLVYKTIHNLKRQTSKKNLDDVELDADVFEDVEKEVSEWAASQEEEIKQLRSLETYRRDFLGNISHELKTPIFNVQGYLFTLLDGAVFDENINIEYLQRAAVNVQRLQTIVEDLERISRLESGELSFEFADFNIRELAEECLEDHKMLAKQKETNLSLKAGADTSYMVNADRESIRQVLNNLLANSIKYGKLNGRTRIGFYDMGEYLLVEVSDNGVGINEEDIKHVFGRFYRVDKSRSRDIGGSGLGLAIVKHIIEAHKQTINLRSTPGVGSTFGFTLEKAK